MLKNGNVFKPSAIFQDAVQSLPQIATAAL